MNTDVAGVRVHYVFVTSPIQYVVVNVALCRAAPAPYCLPVEPVGCLVAETWPLQAVDAAEDWPEPVVEDSEWKLCMKTFRQPWPTAETLDSVQELFHGGRWQVFADDLSNDEVPLDRTQPCHDGQD